MRVSRLGFWLYASARWLLRATGLANCARPLLGARAARWVYQTAGRPGEPLVIEGHRMVLAPPGGYASPDMTNSRYEIATTRLVERLLRPGDSVLDVGAHVGYYTLLAARQVGPEGRVFAFEPEPRNYALLQENIALNGYRNVICVPRAVSRQNGRLPLFLSGLDNGQHSLFRLGPSTPGSVEVETVTLDSFLEDVGWPRIDLVKLDIEGGESAALEGMVELIRRSPRSKFIVEFCPWILGALNIAARRYLDQIRALGFSIQVIEVNRPVPLEDDDVDGLVRRLLQEHSYINLLCARSSP